MSYVYKPGDIFVSAKYGVVTILEVDNESIFPKYKCKVYSKADVRDSIATYDADTFKIWRDYDHYKFYPVVE